jgi:hypothetical protein
VHIGTLFLGAFSPLSDDEFLYAEGNVFAGEAERLLTAVGLWNSREAAQTEFQRRGFLLTHMLECPLAASTEDAAVLLEERFPHVATRIRRSLKPKRVVLISRLLEPLVERFARADLGCRITLDGGKPFGLDDHAFGRAVVALSQILSLSS